MKELIELLWAVLFWGFIVVKLAGHAFAAWSWLWVLAPMVPWLGILVQRLGL